MGISYKQPESSFPTSQVLSQTSHYPSSSRHSRPQSFQLTPSSQNPDMFFPVDLFSPYHHVVFKRPFTTIIPLLRAFLLFHWGNYQRNTALDSKNSEYCVFLYLSVTNRTAVSYHSRFLLMPSWVTIIIGMSWSVMHITILSPSFHVTLSSSTFPEKEMYSLCPRIVTLYLIYIRIPKLQRK